MAQADVLNALASNLANQSVIPGVAFIPFALCHSTGDDRAHLTAVDGFVSMSHGPEVLANLRRRMLRARTCLAVIEEPVTEHLAGDPRWTVFGSKKVLGETFRNGGKRALPEGIAASLESQCNGIMKATATQLEASAIVALLPVPGPKAGWYSNYGWMLFTRPLIEGQDLCQEFYRWLSFSDKWLDSNEQTAVALRQQFA